MTNLLRLAVSEFGADWVMPLDADEFLELSDGARLAEKLLTLELEPISVPWNGFAWSPDENENNEPNPVVRMRLRLPPSPPRLDKVLIPAKWPAEQMEVTQGNHALLRNGSEVPKRRLDGVRLCHFPIRTMSQYAGKIAVGYLQYAALSHWDRQIGFHYIEPFRLLKEQPDEFYQTLSARSLRYSLFESDDDSSPPRDAPLDYRGGKLRFSSQRSSPVSHILSYAETVARKLQEVSWELQSMQRTLLEASGVESDLISRALARKAAAKFSIRGVSAEHETPRSDAVVLANTQLLFQSFWAGGPLSPYELTCLKSFINCGHAFDLYTFDLNLVVPEGVRIRDARTLFCCDDFFVYQDGFGKGSPAAFSNLFRYKLLAQKGGWWVDTDIICLRREIPSFREFFAREDLVLVNAAVLCFEPGHPLMMRCFEEAARLGRSVNWGDAGPRLFTRIVKEQDRAGDALERSICYPVHYSEALDVLCPSKSRSVDDRTQSSLFVHLWNEMLCHYGVEKTKLPPVGSMLRHWTTLNPVTGWTKEYHGEEVEVLALLHIDPGDPDAELTRLWPRSGQIGREIQDGLRREIEELRVNEKEFLASTSWRWTAPARAISRQLRSLVRR
jgi:hypothetical protein